MSKNLIIFIDSGDTIIDESSQVYNDNGIVTRADFIPEAGEVLKSLHKEGYRIALVADGEWESFQNVYRENGLGDCFEQWIVSEVVGEQKPARSMFETAMEKMCLTDVDKSRIVMVGNNLKKDVAGANRFGLISIWMDWSPRYFHQVEEPDWQPDYTVKSPRELKDLIDTLETECAFKSGAQGEMKGLIKIERHYQKMIQDTQDRVIKSLQIQVLDKNSPRYGGFLEESGIVQAKFSIYRVESMTAAYCNKDTVYYHSEKVLQRILLGLDYIRGVQHESGLFDYVTCNFFSAPDTAFCIKKLLPVYQYLSQKAKTPDFSQGEDEILKKLEPIVKEGAKGLLEGGFHTPNHRWAIASVLMTCGKLFDSQEMKDAAFGYLKEGIDCNEDGEFAEKSAGNYNRINNDAMIMLSKATGDDSYEQHAVRNLKMMLTYWEPDDSIFTANSTRFDKDMLIFPKDYYMEFLEMGDKYHIPEFLQMCNSIFEIVDRKHITSPDFLIWFMLNPKFRTMEVEGSYVRPDFRSFYEESGIARGQQGRFTYTVMGGKSNFFYIHNGTMKLEMKVAGSFCEHRAFKSEKMERISDREYHLSQTMRGWYYLPFQEKPATSDWWKMDNASRGKKMGPDMQIDVWVREVEDGVDIRVKTSGVEGAPWRIELAFSGVNFLTNDYMDMPLTGSEVLVVKQGYTEVTNGKDALIVGPCFGEHHFTEGKEDSETKTPGAATLYLTAYTSFDRTIEIRNKRSQCEKKF